MQSLQNTKVLVLGNKSDLESTKSISELTKQYEGTNRHVKF